MHEKGKTMIRKMLPAAALAAGLLVLGARLSAQQQEREAQPDRMPGMGDMMGMMQSCPMMQSGAVGPAAALRYRETLELSDPQVRELESLRDAVRESSASAMKAMRQAHEDLAQASGDAGLDEDRARAALDRMAGTHTEMAMGMLRDRARARSILTPEQSVRLDELDGDMMSMMDMMMRMMHMMGGDSMGGMHMKGDTMPGKGTSGGGK